MKSSERHELATNELADSLGRWLTRIKPYISYILIGIIIVVVAVWLYNKHYRDTERVAAQSVRDFMAAQDIGNELWAGMVTPETQDRKIVALESFISKYPDSPLKRLAQHSLAGELFNRALVNKKPEDLSKAGELYRMLSRGDDAVASWARLGLACVPAGEGDTAGAEAKLVALAEENPGSALETLANERLAALRGAKPLKFAPPGSDVKPDEKTDESGKAGDADKASDAADGEAADDGAPPDAPPVEAKTE